MANLFQRLTTSWTKPNKRNNYWPLSSAVGDAVVMHRTNRKARKHHRAVKRWERRGRKGSFPRYPR